jgi:nitroreductase
LDVFELIRVRRSIRAYKDQPVEKEKLDRILEAARLAPSAHNNQPCHIIVVSDAATKESLGKAYSGEWLMQAPIIIVVCAVPADAWIRSDGEEYWKADAAIAMQNMVLTATELGLGTCWIAMFDEAIAKKALNVPDDVRVVVMTPLGYSAQQKEPVTNRKPLTELIHNNKW